ncbi:MAG TPA: sodium:proton antiporter, partial [Tessaracoccus flavescens]|nr:sodium:proton antiporter [Tessaracoccus flavescens]
NCGGLLTPLGDPPLFMGYLRGVPFEWTFNLLPEWLFVNALTLITYFGLDHLRYSQERPEALQRDESQVDPIRVHGKLNFLFLAVIIAAVALNVPSLDLHAIDAGHATAASWIPWRELLFIAACLGSYFLGDRWARKTGNQFTWGPIIEVAAIFVGIFLTMIPALKFLGQVAPKLPLNDITFFLFSGGLSSVLDNAPTYATFFEMARVLGETSTDTLVAGVPESYLVAISLGAVFCGALTYIGNGPNFMVKAVAENFGVPMPSFGGYVVKSFMFLVPSLLAMMCLFIAEQWWVKVIGAVLTAAIVARALWLVLKHGKASAAAERDA